MTDLPAHLSSDTDLKWQTFCDAADGETVTANLIDFVVAGGEGFAMGGTDQTQNTTLNTDMVSVASALALNNRP
jgi:hypothetical protein